MYLSMLLGVFHLSFEQEGMVYKEEKGKSPYEAHEKKNHNAEYKSVQKKSNFKNSLISFVVL